LPQLIPLFFGWRERIIYFNRLWAPLWSNWYCVEPWITTTWVRISAWAYLKVVSSLISLHYIWRSLGSFSLPCAQKGPKNTNHYRHYYYYFNRPILFNDLRVPWLHTALKISELGFDSKAIIPVFVVWFPNSCLLAICFRCLDNQLTHSLYLSNC